MPAYLVSILYLLLAVNLAGATALTIKSIIQTVNTLTSRKNNPSLTARIFFLFIPLLGKTKKETPWGVVYDAVTKKPIDPALVTIAVHENGVGEYKQTRITDIQGRFSFLVTPARYIITAEKTHYTFPSKIVTDQKDGRYKNVYHGEVIEVENPYIINLNIPMDPVGVDWNQQIKPKAWSIIDIIKENSRAYIIVIGLASSILTYLFLKNIAAIAPIALYLVNTLFWKAYTNGKPWGTIYYRITKEPASRLTVKAIRKPAGITIASTQTDHLGRYFLLLAQGNYTIQVESEKKEGQKPQILAQLQNIVVTKKKEIINQDIGV